MQPVVCYYVFQWHSHLIESPYRLKESSLKTKKYGLEEMSETNGSYPEAKLMSASDLQKLWFGRSKKN